MTSLNTQFPQEFYINQALFNTFEADIKSVYNDPSRVGTLNGVQIRPVNYHILNSWREDMRHHTKQTLQFGLLAITSVLVMGIASAILLATPVGGLVVGTIGLAIFTGSVAKMYLAKKKFTLLKKLYTEQRALEAQTYLAKGPIELIQEKHDLYTQAFSYPPYFSDLYENMSFVDPRNFSADNLTFLHLQERRLEALQRCFIYQQTAFDIIKEDNNQNTVLEFQNSVIDFYRGNGTLTANTLDYCNLLTNSPPTDSRLDLDTVKVCSAKYFPAWTMAR